MHHSNTVYDSCILTHKGRRQTLIQYWPCFKSPSCLAQGHCVTSTSAATSSTERPKSLDKLQYSDTPAFDTDLSERVRNEPVHTILRCHVRDGAGNALRHNGGVPNPFSKLHCASSSKKLISISSGALRGSIHVPCFGIRPHPERLSFIIFFLTTEIPLYSCALEINK